ncbi:MAG: Ntox44 domain-containing protein [Shouchella clausii]|jgi:hypothetical protein
MRNSKFLFLGLSMTLLFAFVFTFSNVTKAENRFSSIGDTTAEVLFEEVTEGESEDLTHLSIEEANQLEEHDYIEYQMQMGNYDVEEDGTVIVYDQRDDGEINASCIACVGGVWKAKKTAGPTTVYGSWKDIASGWGPGSLSKTVSETRTNSYTGTLKASKSLIDKTVGFNISTSKTVSVTYSGTIKSGKQGFLQTRPTYAKYTVKQEYHKLGKITNTTYIYPRKFTITDHRIGYK